MYERTDLSHPLDIVNSGEKDFSILPRLLGKTSYTCFFPTNIFSIVVNCRFIDIHPCLGSISNVFDNKIYRQ